MKVIRRKSVKTFKGKNGKDYHYDNYTLVLDNGSRVAIKCLKHEDYLKLNAVAEYEAKKD